MDHVVTLCISGFNDSDDELEGIARFLAGVSPDIPWHVTAFHQDYKMLDRDATPRATLFRAAAIGRAAGLHYVYAGNLPGRVGELENTRCPGCGETLIERVGFRVMEYALVDGACPRCGRSIPGVWPCADGSIRRNAVAPPNTAWASAVPGPPAAPAPAG